MSFVDELSAIFCAEKYGEYVGGTLSFSAGKKTVGLNVDGRGFVIEDGKEEPYTQSVGERALVCLLYLKHKTPDHNLYAPAKEYLDGKAT